MHTCDLRWDIADAFQNVCKTPLDLFPGMILTLTNCWHHLRLPVWPLQCLTSISYDLQFPFTRWKIVQSTTHDSCNAFKPLSRKGTYSIFFSDLPASLASSCCPKNACWVFKKSFLRIWTNSAKISSAKINAARINDELINSFNSINSFLILLFSSFLPLEHSYFFVLHVYLVRFDILAFKLHMNVIAKC